jgi:hypothetical protein
MTSFTWVSRSAGFAVMAWAMFASSCRTAGFKRVFTALDDRGDRKRTVFFTDTTAIFCVGELVSGRADVTVGSTIRATQLYDPVTDSLMPAQGVAWIGEAAPGTATDTFVSFSLVKAQSSSGTDETGIPYQVGTYTCDLSIDGQNEDSVDFAIEFPACPVLPPSPGEPCAQWVRQGSICDGALGLSCICAASGTWSCQ